MPKITKNVLLGLSPALLKRIDRQASKQNIDRTNFIRKAIENELLRIAFEDEAREQMLANRGVEK